MKKFRVNLLVAFIVILSYGCKKNKERISTPYGIAFKAEDLNSVTDKEIEYFYIDGDFIYMFKKNEDMATYIVPTKNVKLIAPIKKEKPEK